MMEEYKPLLIAAITGSIGAIARIGYEFKENRDQMNAWRVFFIYMTSLVVSYLAFEATNYWNIKKAIGLVSIVGGMISLEIVTIIIEKIPKALAQLPQLGLDILAQKNGLVKKGDDFEEKYNNDTEHHHSHNNNNNNNYNNNDEYGD